MSTNAGSDFLGKLHFCFATLQGMCSESCVVTKHHWEGHSTFARQKTGLITSFNPRLAYKQGLDSHQLASVNTRFSLPLQFCNR